MENLPKLKVGVIGTGALGRHHARLYAQSPNAEMVGIFDVQQEAAKRVAAEFGLKVFGTLEELAAECDALSVAVPADYHAGTVISLLNMGKHVLVEKPIAAKLDEALAMCEAAEKNGVVFGVGHVERFNPATDYLVQRGGKIRFIEAQRLAAYPPARPGLLPRGTEVSVILDLMIHDIDLILGLVKSEVERIDVIGTPVLSAGEDIVNARIKFVNGVCANLTASRVSSEPARRLRVFQEDAFISLDYGNPVGSIVTRCENGLESRGIELQSKNALAEELEDFICAVQQTLSTGKLHDTRVSGRQGLKALEIAIAIEKEARRYNQEYGF